MDAKVGEFFRSAHNDLGLHRLLRSRMMFGVTGIPIRAQLGLDSTQFGLLTATPVFTGTLFRLPVDQAPFHRRQIRFIAQAGYAAAGWSEFLLIEMQLSFGLSVKVPSSRTAD